MTTAGIELFSGNHAIEVEKFAIVFRTPLNNGDDGRFQENIESIKKYFGAIDEPNVLQVFVGTGQKPISKPVLKTLMEFGRDGTAVWSGQFGENAVSVSCNKYVSWQETWPEVKRRLEVLLNCADPFKILSSIEYGVTDTLLEKRGASESLALVSKNIFKEGSWIPNRLLADYHDPRWDFSGGAFVSHENGLETLERVEAKGFISGDRIVASVTNSFSVRFNNPTRLKEVFVGGSVSGLIEDTYARLHDENKVTIKSLLVDALLERMGLK